MTALRDAYGEALVALGERMAHLIVLDADLSKATRTNLFAGRFPDRFVNCGIAEQNLFGVAAGLAASGFVPFASTFAVFVCRALDQIRQSVCYTGMNVKFAGTHTGFSAGPDGATHQANEDLAALRALPGLTIFCPSDGPQTWAAVEAAAAMSGPVYLRISREDVPDLPRRQPFRPGRLEELTGGGDVALLATGAMTWRALKAAELLKARGIAAAVADMGTIWPLDREGVLDLAGRYGRVVTLEDHSVVGGLGSAVAEILVELGRTRQLMLGVPRTFGQSGKASDLYRAAGLDPETAAARIEQWLG